MKRLLLLTVPFFVACGGPDVGVDSTKSPAKPESSINTGPLPEGCVKVEGSDLGVAPLDLGFVQITAWGTNSEGEYISVHWSGDAEVSVKAGRDSFPAEGPCFTTPNGKGISNVVFCEVEEPPPPEEPPPCYSHEDCPYDTFCHYESGECRPGCDYDANCAPGYICIDNQTHPGTCVEP